MTRRLSNLERRGLEHTAREMLESEKGFEARLLVRLLMANGAPVAIECLEALKLMRTNRNPAPAYVYRALQRLRTQLVDMGYPPSVVQIEPSLSACIPAEHAAEIFNWLEAAA